MRDFRPANDRGLLATERRAAVSQAGAEVTTPPHTATPDWKRHTHTPVGSIDLGSGSIDQEAISM